MVPDGATCRGQQVARHQTEGPVQVMPVCQSANLVVSKGIDLNPIKNLRMLDNRLLTSAVGVQALSAPSNPDAGGRDHAAGDGSPNTCRSPPARRSQGAQPARRGWLQSPSRGVAARLLLRRGVRGLSLQPQTSFLPLPSQCLSLICPVSHL